MHLPAVNPETNLEYIRYFICIKKHTFEVVLLFEVSVVTQKIAAMSYMGVYVQWI